MMNPTPASRPTGKGGAVEAGTGAGAMDAEAMVMSKS
jgi:hypothetical protein